jgi:hypothetical protein
MMVSLSGFYNEDKEKRRDLQESGNLGANLNNKKSQRRSIGFSE